MTDDDIIRMLNDLSSGAVVLRGDLMKFAAAASKRLNALMVENAQMLRELADKVEDDERLRSVRDRALQSGRNDGLALASYEVEKLIAKYGSMVSSRGTFKGEAIREAARAIDALLSSTPRREEPA